MVSLSSLRLKIRDDLRRGAIATKGSSAIELARAMIFVVGIVSIVGFNQNLVKRLIVGVHIAL